ncbi:MAG: flagellin FliC [Candidatus Nitrohelix vancouverensis]|uniref:Flagellin n=1 Tax=Candidatus Nitrohelix vancouverensis TaxID=2705534 RepID=A0A7T0C220_9BACT|nr:MAG: flagellin FliC [Candidatus Nitrohelix vancouverensis]
MPVRVFTNISSINAQRNLGLNESRTAKSIRAISQGSRIESAADDIGGVVLSDRLRSDIGALRQAGRNTEDGISMIRTAEAALAVQGTILIRLRELAAQAANGAIGSAERRTLEIEFSQQRNEIDRIAGAAQFNGISLLNGNLSASSGLNISIQVGIGATDDNRINLNTELDLENNDSANLGISTVSVANAESALTALAAVESALQSISQTRGQVGALQNRLGRTLSNLHVSVENISAAESTIRDADIAEEIALLTRNQMLTQAATAMVSQSNLSTQNILSIF